jgi:phospholipid/cholesterol/gamma-HCH transport system substrate-binding protein
VTLPVLLANLTTIGQIGVTYHPSLEQLLVLLPPVVAAFQAALPTSTPLGLSSGSFHAAVSDPPPCTVGFLPPSQWRSPDDLTTVDTPDGLYCKLPQDSPLAVRGARNYPCMGHPGKRAPTVEICDSDKPYEPIALRQHFAGPYPLDPNLLSQGIPPDDRVTADNHIFGPVGGTPLPSPAQLPPPPKLPHPPSMEPLGRGSPMGLSQQSAPGNFAAPAGPFGSPVNLPPGPRGNTMSPPPLGPLAPLDTPGSDAPAPPPSPASPASPGLSREKPAAAKGSFGGSTSNPGPLVAVAEYNPRTGTYVGPAGHLYRQSDLAATSGHRSKTWRDLILAQI